MTTDEPVKMLLLEKAVAKGLEEIQTLRALLEAANEHNASLRSQVEAYVDKSYLQASEMADLRKQLETERRLIDRLVGSSDLVIHSPNRPGDMWKVGTGEPMRRYKAPTLREALAAAAEAVWESE